MIYAEPADKIHSLEPGRLWSLWDKLKLDAAAFYSATKSINHARTSIDQWGPEDTSGINQDSVIDDGIAQSWVEKCEELLVHLEVLEARITAMAVYDVIASLSDTYKPNFKSLSASFSQIDLTLERELSLVHARILEAGKERYYKPKEPAFGPIVGDKLPLTIPDIEDAGKCLAVNQGTACVFHVMRVMESALRGLANLLGISYAPSWESYIKQISTKIDEKHKTKAISWKRDEAFYRDILGDLQAVKLAWRNPTMHIVRRYDIDEAEDIFRAARAFLIRLAPRLPKPRQPRKVN